ncbi:MAG TPA: ABC transporter permease [Victivallales bacterium]|nr:ABC transporter permease [Victivallales bacterium]HRR29024.1 ABC transporter permease [Victivallales bacterium]
MSDFSVLIEIYRKLKKDNVAILGLICVAIFFFFAIFAPLLANNKPFVYISETEFSFPFLRFIFAPDTNEKLVEKTFNFILITFLPIFTIFKTKSKNIKSLLALFIILIIFPFIFVNTKLDRTNWRERTKTEKAFAIFAPIPYSPFESIATPYEKPSKKHILGTDQIGRDVAARMLYGARVSLAVGVSATALTILIGVCIGLISGYFGGKIDLIVMRVVEIIICFPTFLLLLILMSILMDKKFEQSILVVISIIGLTSWTGLSRIVRGEVLQQRQMPYIRACECLALPVWRILFIHLLPNVAGPIFVSFTFGIAGAILAESGLSFLGFGIQPPTASWGELLRQAFIDPKTYWHLTLWPGIAIFAAVLSFNFIGEGLRKIITPN